MSCPSCGSLNHAEFAAEVLIHPGGPAHLPNPAVLAFPKVVICLDCGAARCIIPDAELQILRQRMRPAAALHTGDRDLRRELLSGQATADKLSASKNCIDGGW
jgi:hypothetical protein